MTSLSPAEAPPAAGSLGRLRTPLFLAVLVVGVLLRLATCAHHQAVDYDEGRYLDNAVNILDGRGLSSNYTSHFFLPPAGTGTAHPEDISSPLYPYLLAATFAITGTEPASMHRVAQFWSFVPGCLVILLTFHLGRRLFGETTALLAGLLVALNPDMVILSSWAMTEMLYTALLMGALMIADRRAAPVMPTSRWVALGAVCGLLYLVRANGLAVAGGIGLTTLLPRVTGSASWGRRAAAAALFGCCFLAVASPWLVRNERVFGSPTYTSMKNVAWSEDGRALFTRGGEPPTLGSFVREHGAAGLLRNLASRAVRSVRFVIWGDTGGYNAVCVLFPVAVVLARRQRRLIPGNLCVLITAILLLGVPTWTGALSRYLLPLRPWMYLVVVGSLLHLLPEMLWRRGEERRLRAGGGQQASPRPAMSRESLMRLTAALAATAIAVMSWASIGPLRAYVSGDEATRDLVARQAAAWIRSQTPPGSVLMEGAFVHQYAFLYDRPVVWVPAGGLDMLLSTAADYGASYLVVSPALLRFHPELRAHFTVEEGGVRGIGLPDGFVEVYAGQGRRVVIWRLPKEGAA